MQAQAAAASSGGGATTTTTTTRDDGLSDVMAKLQSFMRRHGADARKVFDACDLDGSGRLEFPELREMIKQLVPGVSARDLRHMLVGMRAIDVDGGGDVSYPELLRGLRLATIKRVKPKKAAASAARGKTERQPSRDSSTRSSSKPPPSPMAKTKTKTGERAHAEDWSLDAVTVDGKSFLVDRGTGVAYVEGSNGGWPRAVGILDPTGRAIVPIKARGAGGSGKENASGDATGGGGSKDLFAALDRYLKTEKRRLRDVFDAFDLDKDGALDRRELSRAIAKILPSASNHDMHYFRVMLDVDGDGVLTFDELLGTIRDFRAAGVAMEAAADETEPPEALRRLSDFMRHNAADVRAVFDACDLDGSGYLEYPELWRMVGDLVPSATTLERRSLLAGLWSADVDGDGRVSYDELLRALRLVNVVKVDARGGDGGGVDGGADAARSSVDRRRRTSPAAPPTTPATFEHPDAVPWELEDVYGDGSLLLDHDTKQVFEPDEATKKRDAKRARAAAAAKKKKKRRRERKKRTKKKKNASDASSDSDSDSDASSSSDSSEASSSSSSSESDSEEDATHVSDKVSDNASAAGAWPTLVGVVDDDGKITPVAPMRALFDAMKAHFERKKSNLRKLFKKHDERRRGLLDASELSRMIRAVYPAASDAEIAYFTVMLDLDGDDKTSVREIEICVMETELEGKDAARVKTAPTVPDFLQKIATRVDGVDERKSTAAFFDAALDPPIADPRRPPSFIRAKGLDAFHLQRLVAGAYGGARGVSHAETRYLVSQLMCFLDVDGDAMVSLPELRRGLRLAVARKTLAGEWRGESAADGAPRRAEAAVEGGPAAGTPRAKKKKKKTPTAKKSTTGGAVARAGMDAASGAAKHVGRTRSGTTEKTPFDPSKVNFEKVGDGANSGRSGHPASAATPKSDDRRAKVDEMHAERAKAAAEMRAGVGRPSAADVSAAAAASASPAPKRRGRATEDDDAPPWYHPGAERSSPSPSPRRARRPMTDEELLIARIRAEKEAKLLEAKEADREVARAAAFEKDLASRRKDRDRRGEVDALNAEKASKARAMRNAKAIPEDQLTAAELAEKRAAEAERLRAFIERTERLEEERLERQRAVIDGLAGMKLERDGDGRIATSSVLDAAAVTAAAEDPEERRKREDALVALIQKVKRETLRRAKKDRDAIEGERDARYIGDMMYKNQMAQQRHLQQQQQRW